MCNLKFWKTKTLKIQGLLCDYLLPGSLTVLFYKLQNVPCNLISFPIVIFGIPCAFACSGVSQPAFSCNRILQPSYWNS